MRVVSPAQQIRQGEHTTNLPPYVPFSLQPELVICRCSGGSGGCAAGYWRSALPGQNTEREGMKAQEDFEEEMRLLERKVGQDAIDRTYCVLTLLLRWLRCHGHGDVTLSAINHMFGAKIRGDTVFTVRP